MAQNTKDVSTVYDAARHLLQVAELLDVLRGCKKIALNVAQYIYCLAGNFPVTYAMMQGLQKACTHSRCESTCLS